MTWDNTTPTAGQSLGNSRPTVLAKFNTLQTAIQTNHGDITTADTGKHTFIQWVVQASDPTTAAGEIARYTKLVSSVAYEHIRQPSDGTVIQMTGKSPIISANGSTFLPGGLLLQWGTSTVTGTLSVSFPIAFSTAPYSVQITQYNTAGSSVREFFQVSLVAAATFTIQVINASGGGLSPSARPCFWMAIGKQ